MPGTPIQTFNDFMNATGPTYLTSADQVINEAVKNTYAFSRLLKEKTSEATVQGGNEIRDVIMFDDASTYDHYLPNDTFSWRNANVTDTVRAPWRFSIDHMAWTDHEVELNSGNGSTRDYVKAQYKRLKRIKEQRMWTSLTNGFENDLWASTFNNNVEMEGNAGKLPYSLPSFITEIPMTSTPFGADQRGDAPFGWANVMNLSPTAEPRWSNQISYYDPAPANSDPNTPLSLVSSIDNVRTGTNPYSAYVGGLLTAFDEMFLKLDFRTPSTRAEYFEKPSMNRQMILCSRLGINQYKQALRASNDTLVSYQDPAYNAPTYSGIELMYCSNLDNAALAPSGGGTRTTATTNLTAMTGYATEASATDPGARYWWVNGNYLTPIFHSRRYFEKHEVLRHPNQPFTYVQVVDCWWNLFCNSRQRQGIIAPLSVA
jgi:hypothetical protein